MRIHEETLVLSQHRFKGWILDALWRESSSALQLSPTGVYLFSSETKNRALSQFKRFHRLLSKPVLSIHQSNLNLLEAIGMIEKCNNHNVIITHINPEENLHYLSNHFAINKNLRFLTMNKNTKMQLMALGIPQESVSVIYGAIDRKVFRPSEEAIQGSYILIGGDCKPRKNPAMIRELVLNNPDLKFVFEGYAWKKFFSDIVQFNANISFWDRGTLSLGDLYRNASVLCNLSLLEGGPIPVLQALASGTPILSSDVGFVSEVLAEDFGRVINLDLTIQEISVMLREVASTKRLVSTKDGLEGKFSWEDLGRNLFACAD